MSNIQTKKTDRRVIRTRRSLREALFVLILEKGYDAVTVEEIATRANVGRTTFYLHYRDKEDLLLKAVGDVVDDLVNHLSQISLAGVETGGEENSSDPMIPAISEAFSHVAQNADLYRILLRGNWSDFGLKRLRQIISQAIDRFNHQLADRNNLVLHPQVPMEVFLNSLAGAWIGLVTWWLEEDMPYPPEEMARMYQRMFLRSTREVLGLSASLE